MLSMKYSQEGYELSYLTLIFQFLIGMFIIRSAFTHSKIPKALSISSLQSYLRFISSKAVIFSFATSKWNKKQFLKKLDREIMDSHAQIVWEDPTTEAYFANKHWKIKYIEEKTMFEYSKIDGKHQIRVLTYVMYAPPNDPDHAEYFKSQEKDPKAKPNYSQVGIYIRKIGAQKWLTAEMAVLEGSIELLGVFFTSLEPSFNWDKNTYPGPQLKSLPEKVLSGINGIFAQFGLTTELIMNMVIHASIKVDPLDLEWLKNLRQIWA